MKVKEILRKLSLMIIAILFPLCDFANGQMGAFQVVSPERIPEILDEISTHVRQNFVQINTLEGEIQVSWYDVYKGEKAKRVFESNTDAVGDPPDRIARLRESTTTFSCDMKKELYYGKASGKMPLRHVDLADNRDLGTKVRSSSKISIVTPEYQLSSSPTRWRDGHVVQSRGVKEKVDLNCPTGIRHLFNEGPPEWLYYPRIVEIIKEEGNYVVDDEYSFKVEQRELEGKVQYRVYEPAKVGAEGDNIWLIKTYSTDVGWNMISFEETYADGSLIHRKGLEYQSVQGIYMLKKRTHENFDLDDGSLRRRKEQLFNNVRLNAVIPADTFTFKNLGLKNGDKFVDKIEDKEYIMQDQKLILKSN